MFNRLFSIGPFTVYMYGVMIALGVLTAVLVSMYRAKRRGLVPDEVLSFALYGIISGVVGAKLMYCIVHLREVIADPTLLWNGSGMLVYGAIIGAIGTLVLYCRRKKLKFFEYFDLIMPSILLAQGFGRIGCFFAGCCYGKETTSCIGLVFPEGSIAPAGVPLWPTQLVSAGWHFLCAAVLFRYEKNPAHRKTVGIAYLTLFGIGRFIIDFFRGDKQNVVRGVSLSQIGSIALAAAGAVLIAVILHRRKRNAETEAEDADEEDGEETAEENDGSPEAEPEETDETVTGGEEDGFEDWEPEEVPEDSEDAEIDLKDESAEPKSGEELQ